MALLTVDTSSRTFTCSKAHRHEGWEIILTLEGEGITLIGEEEFSFRPGSIHVIPPRTLHEKRSESGFKDVYFRVDSFSAPGEPFCVEDDAVGTLSTLIKGMLYHHMREEKNEELLSLMCELALRLILENKQPLSKDPVVEGICRQFALRHNDPELSVSSVLEATGYQKDHVRRRFLAALGVTPGEYLTSLRIEKAKKLLRQRKESGLSVAEIGASCGYYDSRYFSRVFKKHTGLSPEGY